MAVIDVMFNVVISKVKYFVVDVIAESINRASAYNNNVSGRTIAENMTALTINISGDK